MSVGKELREFAQEPSEKQPSTPTHAAVSRMLGITAANMQETIIADICGMIDEGYRPPLEGYILCLSRIVSHNVAWRCITEAFSNKKESVPKKYYDLFGQEQKTPPKSRMTVEG